MSNNDDYIAKLDLLKSIEEEAISSPTNVPVDVYLQEAENLYHWAGDDRAKLEAIGLDGTLVDDLPVRCGALREAESLWNKKRFTREDAEQTWAEKSPEAYDLRNELLHQMRFAYRDDENLLRKVNDIGEGAGHADMLQDLNDLSVLGKANPLPLTAIAFDLTLLDTAAQKADELASLLGIVTGDRMQYDEKRVIRDQAFSHLKEAVDVIRKFGQFVFWRNEKRKRGYISNYLRYRRMKSKKAAEEAAAAEAAADESETS
jgi:hypothetical protein